MRREAGDHDRYKAQCPPCGVLALHLEQGVAPRGRVDVHLVRVRVRAKVRVLVLVLVLVLVRVRVRVRVRVSIYPR
jgi:hypothetical protein